MLVTSHTLGRSVERLICTVAFTMMALLTISANTYADVLALENTTIYYSDGGPYSVAGGGQALGFATGTVLTGAGNGVGFAHDGGNAGMYAVTSSSYNYVTSFGAGTTMAGLGDGTALALDGTSLYFVTPTGYRQLGNFAAETNMVGAGNGVGFAHEGGNAGLYAVTSSGYTDLGSFNAGTMLAGAGNGIGYAMEGAKLYRLSTTGYQWVDDFVSPSILIGSGDGSAFVLDSSNSMLYHVSASGNGRQIVGSFAANTIMANIGVPVPEPGMLSLSAMGLIGLLAYAWRKRR